MKKIVTLTIVICTTLILSLVIIAYLSHSNANIGLKFKSEAMILTNTKFNIDIEYNQKK